MRSTGMLRCADMGVPGIGVPGIGVPSIGVPGIGVPSIKVSKYCDARHQSACQSPKRHVCRHAGLSGTATPERIRKVR